MMWLNIDISTQSIVFPNPDQTATIWQRYQPVSQQALKVKPDFAYYMLVLNDCRLFICKTHTRGVGRVLVLSLRSQTKLLYLMSWDCVNRSTEVILQDGMMANDGKQGPDPLVML